MVVMRMIHVLLDPLIQLLCGALILELCKFTKYTNIKVYSILGEFII